MEPVGVTTLTYIATALGVVVGLYNINVILVKLKLKYQKYKAQLKEEKK